MSVVQLVQSFFGWLSCYVAENVAKKNINRIKDRKKKLQANGYYLASIWKNFFLNFASYYIWKFRAVCHFSTKFLDCNFYLNFDNLQKFSNFLIFKKIFGFLKFKIFKFMYLQIFKSSKFEISSLNIQVFKIFNFQEFLNFQIFILSTLLNYDISTFQTFKYLTLDKRTKQIWNKSHRHLKCLKSFKL